MHYDEASIKIVENGAVVVDAQLLRTWRLPLAFSLPRPECDEGKQTAQHPLDDACSAINAVWCLHQRSSGAAWICSNAFATSCPAFPECHFPDRSRTGRGSP